TVREPARMHSRRNKNRCAQEAPMPARATHSLPTAVAARAAAGNGQKCGEHAASQQKFHQPVADLSKTLFSSPHANGAAQRPGIARGCFMFSKKFLSGVALTALSMAATTGVAHAQSTASQITDDEIIVVTGARQEGEILNETAPRARASITADYIESQASGQTVL